MKKILLLFGCLIFSSHIFAITANDDLYSMEYDGWGLSFATRVTANDTYSGSVTITQISSTSVGVTVNSGGNITVQGYVLPGVYTLVYQICEVAVPTNCDTATVTVVVGGVINAVNDTYCMTKSTSTTTLSPTILANDTRDSGPATTGNTDMTLLTSIPGISLSLSGAIQVQSSVAPGVYVLQYELCHTTYPVLCDTATITITVGNPMSAVNDNAVISYDPGTQTIIDILDNDIYNGGSATTSNVDVTILTSPLPTGLNYNATTTTFSSTGLATGTYNIQYQICDNATPCSCKAATATIIVTTDSDELSPSDVRADDIVTVSGVQANNKIIIAGEFANYSGSPANKIARLNYADLTLDTSFNNIGPLAGGYNTVIKDFEILPNGNIVVVGTWYMFNGAFHGRNIIMLDTNGNPVPGWNGNNGASATSVINAVAVTQNQEIIVAGNFTDFNATTKYHLAKLNPNGSIVNTFNAPTGGTNGFTGGFPLCLAIHNNSVIVGGSFTHFKGQLVNGIVKLSINTGAIDSSFNPGGLGIPNGSQIEEILVNGNDIYIGGTFTSYNGIQRNRIAKIDPNGNLISGFTGGFDGTVRALAFQQTPSSFVSSIGASNLYVGGDFTNHSYGGTTTFTPKIAALNPSNGNKNPLFNPGSGPDNPVHTLTLENSKVKLILGGAFQNYHGTNADYVTRVFPGGLGTGQQGRLNMFDNADTAISIFPNPSEGLFTIDFKGYDEQRFTITVHNVLGQLIYSGEVTAQSPAQLDLSGANSGNYFVTLQNSTETINKIITKK